MDIVIWDTETTGKDSNAEVIQIAGIVTDFDLKPKLVFNRYCWTNQEIHPDAEATHGVNRETLLQFSCGRFFEDILDDIPFFRDNPNQLYIAYNQSFDKRVVNHTLFVNGYDAIDFGRELRTLKYGLQEGRYNVCALNLIRSVLVGGHKRPLIESVCIALKITPQELSREYGEFCKLLTFKNPKTGFHDALFDSYAIWRVISKFRALMYN